MITSPLTPAGRNESDDAKRVGFGANRDGIVSKELLEIIACCKCAFEHLVPKFGLLETLGARDNEEDPDDGLKRFFVSIINIKRA